MRASNKEMQAMSLTLRAYHEISDDGIPMQSVSATLKPPSRLRPFTVVIMSSAALVLWAVGVFYYNINDYFLFNQDTWWINFRDIFNVPFLVDSTIAAFKEQWVALLALSAFTFLPLCKRAIQDRPRPGDHLKLLLSLAFIHLLLAAQLFYLQGQEIGYSTFGVFFVVVAGLIGGWRLGLQIGIVNMLFFGGIHYYYDIIANEASTSFIRMVLTELHLIAPIWGGAIAGYIGQSLGNKRFNWSFVLGIGLATECLLVATTVISSWAPAAYVQQALYHVLATPLMFLGFSWLMHYHLSSSGEGKLKMTQTELALAEAELKALRAQINPHFMVNSLSVIHHLVRTQPDIARNLLLDLSDLFQHSLRAGDFVPLRQELEHVRAYLALEQARLTKRLNVMWAVLADDKLDTPVPTLILQPIIENAIVHGISPKPEGGTVSILVKQTGSNLHIQVADNGVGFNVDALQVESERPSIGLKNVDVRLKLIYGEAYRLQIDSTPGAGTTMEFRIPLVQVLEPLKESKELVSQ
jgi:LytS/YehU family sensor histidine kinase